MSDSIKHECGIALVRLLKPLEYYTEKYGTPLYGFNLLFMLMQKQHNRGQDGAGIGCVKLSMPAGKTYMLRERSADNDSLSKIVTAQLHAYNDLLKEGKINPHDSQSIKEHWRFGAELLMGHLRYGTSGNYDVAACHPYVRRSNWPTRNLMLAGNFNMTNSSELNQELISRGQHPIFNTDTQTLLEAIGYQLDEEHTQIYREMRDSNTPNDEIPKIISERLNPNEILIKAAQNWDGGYVISGLIGNGDAFVARDPHGIRPGFYYKDEEIVAVASERVALMTALDLDKEAVQELTPGHTLVIKSNGATSSSRFTEEKPPTPCSFERIYFSRGNDPDIYQERKALGAALAKLILKSINNDFKHTIFSYIPNTAESAYYGLLDELRSISRDKIKCDILKAHQDGTLTEAYIDELIRSNWTRAEKTAIKDIKLRTFISQENDRHQLASHVYDVTYGIVKKEDTLVCIDDSIVRGTTLKQSILKILSRTRPKKIIIASTAPQIRYPDCYGIDMSEMGKFIAFQATIQLLQEAGKSSLIKSVYKLCRQDNTQNHVKHLYNEFTPEQISQKIAQIVFPERDGWEGELEIIYLDIEGLHNSLIQNCGDWYFTGNYPTPGGYAVLNQSFINYYENREGRSYETDDDRIAERIPSPLQPA